MTEVCIVDPGIFPAHGGLPAHGEGLADLVAEKEASWTVMSR